MKNYNCMNCAFSTPCMTMHVCSKAPRGQRVKAARDVCPQFRAWLADWMPDRVKPEEKKPATVRRKRNHFVKFQQQQPKAAA
jgi:hypothetical protein